MTWQQLPQDILELILVEWLGIEIAISTGTIVIGTSEESGDRLEWDVQRFLAQLLYGRIAASGDVTLLWRRITLRRDGGFVDTSLVRALLCSLASMRHLVALDLHEFVNAEAEGAVARLGNPYQLDTLSLGSIRPLYLSQLFGMFATMRHLRVVHVQVLDHEGDCFDFEQSLVDLMVALRPSLNRRMEHVGMIVADDLEWLTFYDSFDLRIHREEDDQGHNSIRVTSSVDCSAALSEAFMECSLSRIFLSIQGETKEITHDNAHLVTLIKSQERSLRSFEMQNCFVSERYLINIVASLSQCEYLRETRFDTILHSLPLGEEFEDALRALIFKIHSLGIQNIQSIDHWIPAIASGLSQRFLTSGSNDNGNNFERLEIRMARPWQIPEGSNFISRLGKFNLVELRLSYIAFGSTCQSHLAQVIAALTRLRHLEISHSCSGTDDGWKSIFRSLAGHDTLTEIDFSSHSWAPISNTAIAVLIDSLCTFNSLQILSLADSAINDEMAVRLADALCNYHHDTFSLDVNGCRKLGFAAKKTLSRTLQSRISTIVVRL